MHQLSVWLLLAIALFGSACSQTRMMRLLTRSPEVGQPTRTDHVYTDDAGYLVAVLQDAYPLLYQRLPVFDSLASEYLAAAARTQSDTSFYRLSQRFLAHLHDGHTYVYSPHWRGSGGPYYPYLLNYDTTGLTVVALGEPLDTQWIGSRVVQLNGHDLDHIQAALWATESADYPDWAYDKGASSLSSPQYLAGLGLADEQGGVSLHLRQPGGQDTTLQLLPRTDLVWQYQTRPANEWYEMTRQKNRGFYYRVLPEQNFAYLQLNTLLDYATLRVGIKDYMPFFLVPIGRAFMKKQKRDAQDFGLLMAQLVQEMHTTGTDHLVVDLRYNPGGDVSLGKQLLWYTTTRRDIQPYRDYYLNSRYFRQQVKGDYRKHERAHQRQYGRPLPQGLVNLDSLLYPGAYFDDITDPKAHFHLDTTLAPIAGQLYVLTDHRTYSAAAVLATTIRDNQLGTLVGTPVGNLPTTATGASAFKLPRTKGLVFTSYLYLQRPDLQYAGENVLLPDVYRPPTTADYFQRRDAALEWVMQDIKQRNP